MIKTQGEAGLRINDLIKMFQYKYYNGQNPKKSWSKKSNEKYDKYLIHITYYYMHMLRCHSIRHQTPKKSTTRLDFLDKFCFSK